MKILFLSYQSKYICVIIKMSWTVSFTWRSLMICLKNLCAQLKTIYAKIQSRTYNLQPLLKFKRFLFLHIHVHTLSLVFRYIFISYAAKWRHKVYVPIIFALQLCNRYTYCVAISRQMQLKCNGIVTKKKQLLFCCHN